MGCVFLVFFNIGHATRAQASVLHRYVMSSVPAAGLSTCGDQLWPPLLWWVCEQNTQNAASDVWSDVWYIVDITLFFFSIILFGEIEKIHLERNFDTASWIFYVKVMVYFYVHGSHEIKKGLMFSQWTLIYKNVWSKWHDVHISFITHLELYTSVHK